ncbi:MAG: glycosyltransferase [Thiotrichales bacterium]
MTPRLAIVRQGEFLATLLRATTGHPRARDALPASIAAIHRLQRSFPALVIDHDAGIDRFTQRQRTRFAGVAHLPEAWLRASAAHVLGWTTYWTLSRYRPTHLLLADDGPVGFYAAWYARRHQVSTLAAFAGPFASPGIAPARYMLCLNQPNVCCVASFGRYNIQTLLEHGLNPRKATAYELEPLAHDPSRPPRERSTNQPLRVRFEGPIRTNAGPFELVEAVLRLASGGVNLTLEVVGDGPAWQRLRNLANTAPRGLITLAHPLDDGAREAPLDNTDVVYVALDAAASAQLPATLSAALRARIPVVAPNDGAITADFRHGEGLLLHRPGDVTDLARQLQRLASDLQLYRALAVATRDAYLKSRGRTTFAELIDAWRLVIESDARSGARPRSGMALRQSSAH